MHFLVTHLVTITIFSILEFFSFKMSCNKISGSYFGILWLVKQPRCFKKIIIGSSHENIHQGPAFTTQLSRHRMNVMLQTILAKPSSQRTPAPPPGQISIGPELDNVM